MSLSDRLRTIERELLGLQSSVIARAAGVDLLVIEVPARMNDDLRQQVAIDVEAQLAGTGTRLVTLSGGAKLARPTDTQLDDLQQAVAALDAKVTALLDALAQEGEESAEERIDITTLDGERFEAAERDQTESLG